MTNLQTGLQVIFEKHKQHKRKMAELHGVEQRNGDLIIKIAVSATAKHGLDEVFGIMPLSEQIERCIALALPSDNDRPYFGGNNG